MAEELPEVKPEIKPVVKTEEENQEISPKISINEFAKVQMRVGQILEAEKIEGSRKLIKLRVDIGDEVRQVVAGISEAYAPDDLLYKKVI